MTSANDRVRITIRIAASPARAFAVFTEQIDVWWRRGPRFRFGRTAGNEGGGSLSFLDGTLVERFADGTSWEVGRVLEWKAGVRLVFEWRASNFTAGECTEVDVRFVAAADDPECTLVTLEHRGWSKIRSDHPARHGKTDPAFAVSKALWWNDLAASYRRAVTDVSR